MAGGDRNGWNQRVATYTPNSLNQYSQRTLPGAVDIMGLSLATNPVTVNTLPAYRKGEYFRQQVSVNNTNVPVWEGITVTAGQASVSGSQFVPRTPEVFLYDQDGNLTNDGHWAYTWDAENRLVGMVANNSVAPAQLLTFAYDYKGRRISKAVWNNTTGSGNPAASHAFVYDGWNLLAELNTVSTPTLLRAFVWGSDLSGSLQGAGGIGGLLELTFHGTQTTNCFVAFDGNGNMATLVNAADGTLGAQYEYGPFGEVLRATGPLAKVNPFRFSTKYQDDETDMVYYCPGRYYIPSTGRWASRDPIAELGFQSVLRRKSAIMRRLQGNRLGEGDLYTFVKNDPIGKIDPDGLDTWCPYPYPGHYCSDPKPCDPAIACCDAKKIAEGLKTLTDRWHDAAKYLDANGVQLNPDDIGGVSCVQSANHILAFMVPIPPCWKCYIQRRGWNYLPWVGDENSIRCDVQKPSGWGFSVVFDWWYEKYEGYKSYSPIPMWKYRWMFPYDLNPAPNGWWTERNPAPHDDCVNKSPIPPERYDQLKPLLPPYGRF